MKVFITGGTGIVGNILVDELLKKNHEVTVLTRNISNVKNKWKATVNLVEGNPNKIESWTNEVNGHDGIINLAGANIFDKRWTKNRKKELIKSRVDVGLNLIHAINQAQNKPKVIVSVSGVDYYPSDGSDYSYNEDDTNSDSFIGSLAKQWENSVLNNNLPNLRTIVYRMGVAFSKTNKTAEKMFIPHKFFVGGWVGSGKQWYSWLHVADFVNLLLWGLENDNINGIYNGVSPEPMQMKEIAKIGGKILGRWTWTFIPGFILHIVLGERAKLLLDGRKVSCSKIQKTGFQFKYPSIHSTLEDILS
ncbi:MAG: TIGR01777 family oxidoreductase [Candidatus Heimdallarchaeota archaeon]|nr:TIGR01777 family oxidoreductase [Candidatus Heimdallarchaeota archaeon]MDH5646155.1 TIGR01777 family oxidoreductase [Candidatus Heimdallarchaeota archaeon]